MDWNEQDFVLSADSQFNNGPVHVPGMDEFPGAFNAYDSEYQVIVSHALGSLFGTDRHYEPLSGLEQLVFARKNGMARTGRPVEFYQSHVQKPQFYVDFRGRGGDVAEVVMNHHEQINWMFGEALGNRGRGESIDLFVAGSVKSIFEGYDDELQGILTGYFLQMPRRVLMYFDIEVIDEADSKNIIKNPQWYFNWLESAYDVLGGTLNNFGIPFAVNVTGKGYHFFVSVPLEENGHLTDAIMEVTRVGGHVQPETMDRLVRLGPGDRRVAPTPILSQRAYQGAFRLAHFLVMNTIDDVREDLSRRGFPPYVGVTDNAPLQIAFDLTCGLRQVNMSCFGSPGSLYNKDPNSRIVRIPRARNGEDFFNGNIDHMLATRGSVSAAKDHLVNVGCFLPEAVNGIEPLVRAYESSRVKRELWDQLDRNVDEGFVQELINTNYQQYRERCPEIKEHLNVPDGRFSPFLNPKALEYIFGVMHNRGASLWEMMHLQLAVFRDGMKNIDIGPYYSRTEWAKWPILLRGEDYKG